MSRRRVQSEVTDWMKKNYGKGYTIRQIAAYSGTSDRTVRRVLGQLAREGKLRKELDPPRTGRVGGNKRTARYQLIGFMVLLASILFTLGIL